MINWKVRLKSKTFWLSFVPAILILAQVVAQTFGYQWQLDGLNDQIIAIINAAFVLLAILGVVVDPTTSGISDSEQALSYTEPKADQ